MESPRSETDSVRVLILAPYGRDSELISGVLTRSRIAYKACKDIRELTLALAEGAGTALIADEALPPHAAVQLAKTIAAQPPWADFPVIVLTSGGDSNEESRLRLRSLESLGNVALLERPLRIVTLLSSVHAALRARKRQYLTGQLLEEREKGARALRESEAQFRSMANSMAQLAWLTRPDGSVLWFNDRWFEYTGMDASAKETWPQWISPEFRPNVEAAWAEALQRRQSFELEFLLRGAKDGYRWFLTRAVPLFDDDGSIVRWFGTLTDIDEQKRTEEALRRANRDLEQFAFSASHDLQEPLRMVSIYSQLLKARFSEQIDEEADLFIQNVVNGAQRARSLIQDLLEYTQVSEASPTGTEVTDTEAIVAKAISHLEGAIAENGAEIVVRDLPPLPMHEVHLTQIFQNLIGNAIKYRGADPPRIEVSSRRDPGEIVICVADNGIGIEPAYLHKIFGLFKRLHGSEKYQGTGIGLALCQRIVERYGGRIWAESEFGKGSEFCFAIPLMLP